jgi:cytochrome oxidase assembly protein ShyY1
VRSWAFLLTRRWIVFAIMVALLAYLAWWLGEWQFRRLDDRHQRNAVFERNVSAEPVAVTDVLRAESEVARGDEWRRVTMTGTYDPTRTVVVRYQTRDRASGIDVVVPFLLPDGRAVLVDRGWLQAANDGTAAADIPQPPGTGASGPAVTVIGWARRDATGNSTRVADVASGLPPSTRAISSATISRAIDVKLLRGFVVLQKEEPAPETPLLAAELPEVGNGPHFFYGLQWWFFGLLAVGGFGYLAYDERRRPRTDQPTTHHQATGPPQQPVPPRSGHDTKA